MSNESETADDEMNCGLTVDEHACLRQQLDRLADSPPPRVVWNRIQEQAQAEGLLKRSVLNERTRWFVGSGIAAAVVLAVLNLPYGLPVDDTGASGVASESVGPEEFGTVPPFDPEQVRFDPINALMVQSRLLEQDLRRMPEQPELARAETLATIDELQNRIAAIDYRLSDPDAALSIDEQEMYWQERVRLLDSLLQLRYAQSQRVWF